MTGSLVKSLANSHIASQSIPYVWDGERDDGEMVPEGIYVIHLEGYNFTTGERLIKRAAIGVLYR